MYCLIVARCKSEDDVFWALERLSILYIQSIVKAIPSRTVVLSVYKIPCFVLAFHLIADLMCFLDPVYVWKYKLFHIIYICVT